MTNHTGTLTVKVLYFCEVTQTHVNRCTFLLQLLYLCSYSSNTCRMHLRSARLKSVAEGQTTWFLLHSAELEELIPGWEGPWGGDSRRSTAVLWQLNGMDGSPFSLLPLGLIPAKELQYLTFNCFYTGVVCLTWNDSILNQEVCSEVCWRVSPLWAMASLCAN